MLSQVLRLPNKLTGTSIMIYCDLYFLLVCSFFSLIRAILPSPYGLNSLLSPGLYFSFLRFTSDLFSRLSLSQLEVLRWIWIPATLCGGSPTHVLTIWVSISTLTPCTSSSPVSCRELWDVMIRIVQGRAPVHRWPFHQNLQSGQLLTMNIAYSQFSWFRRETSRKLVSAECTIKGLVPR